MDQHVKRRLRDLAQHPKTKAGQIRWLWPEIKAAVATGHTLKETWEEASRNGLDLSYSSFRLYVARLKSTDSAPTPTPNMQAAGEKAVVEPQEARAEAKSVSGPDPFANLREQREKQQKSSFEYNPIPTKTY
jgi:hypothetical protein